MYVARRLASSLLVLVAVSYGSFWVVASHINPLYSLLLENPRPTALINRLTAVHHLADPIPVRYGRWLLGLFAGGNSGRMILSDQPVWPLVETALLHTAELAAISIVVVTALSALMGALSAYSRGSVVDVVLRGLGYFTWSIPTFVVALAAQAVLVRLGTATGWHPLYLSGRPGSAGPTSGLASGVDWVRHMALPVAVVALGFVGHYARYIRSSLTSALNAPYSTVARAKGLTDRAVLFRHALRNALIPFVAVLSLDLGSLIGATFVADIIFGLQGLGSLFLSSIRLGDPLLTQSLLMTTAVVMIVFSLLGDVAVSRLDPRIRSH